MLECVGTTQSTRTAIGIARPGGAVGRVGVPALRRDPGAQPSFFKNVTVGGGPAPVRAYIDELLPDVLEGRIEPGRVFDRTVGLDGVPDGYRAMDDRESIKVMVTPWSRRYDFKGQVALVTGASSGMGLAAAHARSPQAGAAWHWRDVN